MTEKNLPGLAENDVKSGVTADQRVLVTVVIATYNHVQFIAAAIDSVLAQGTQFPFEIIISEDASTDGTRAIVENYAARFPDRIRLMLSEKNLHSTETIARGIRAARGEYVALLDGDDCWLKADKLQRQADFLSDNPDHAAHFFNARIANGTELTEKLWTPTTQARSIDLAEIWHGNPYATAAGMMRTAAIRHVPDWYHGLFLTDWPLYILCAITGRLAFDPEAVALYRLHDGGVYSSLTEAKKLANTYVFLTRMNNCLDRRFNQMARAGCTRLFHDWAIAYLDDGQIGLAWKSLGYSLRGGGVGLSVSWRQSLRLFLRILKMSVTR